MLCPPSRAFTAAALAFLQLLPVFVQNCTPSLPLRSYFNGLDLTGTTKSRARVTLAGAIIATIALFALLLAVHGRGWARGGQARVGWRACCCWRLAAIHCMCAHVGIAS